MLKVFEGFRHQTERRITGMTATCGAGREWEYPLVMASIDDTLLHTIGEYITSWHATIAEKVVYCPIYELYVNLEWMSGTNWMVIWWD